MAALPEPIDGMSDRRRLGATLTPVIVVALAGMAVRTPLAAAYPFAALLLFLWIVADTLMLALLARARPLPSRREVLAVLAGASLTVALGSPPPLRAVLLETPALVVVMSVVLLSHVVWALGRAGRVLREPGSAHAKRWSAAASELLAPALVRLAVAELTVIHMALLRWGGPADVPANARAFAYHRHLAPICAALLGLSAIEIAVYHILVGHWSRIAGIVMFVLSDVGFVYLVGLIKSFRFRPVLLTPEGVHVRAGLMIDRLVPLDAIVAVSGGFSGEGIRDPGTLNAALLAWPNVLLRLDRPFARPSLLKKRRTFDKVAFRLDDPEPFVRLLAWRLGQRAG